jgi:hypothetical protein
MSTRGFIYPFLKKTSKFIYSLNPVELIKKKTGRDRLAVDYFIIGKWIMVLIFLFWNPGNITLRYIFGICAGVLCFFNLITYLKYHLIDQTLGVKRDADSRIRSLLYAIQAFLFSIICFSYFYVTNNQYHFYFDLDYNNSLAAIFYSISNSIAATNFNKIISISSFGDFIISLQLIHSVIFITILLGSTINSLKE